MYQLAIRKIMLIALLCIGLIINAGAQQPAQGTIIAVMHIDAMPPYTKDVTALLTTYLHETLKEDGIKRCKILQEAGRANHFTVVEDWATQAAYDAHTGAAHTRKFRNDIQPMLGAPIDERLHTELE